MAGVTAGLLAFSGLALAATPASAQAGFDFERLSGPDRFETAADIAVKTFGTADTVLLATGVKFPDALTGNYLAGATGDTPILLTLPDAVPPATRDALETLGATKVIILGGTTAVSPAVENDLNDNYTVERLGGSDRYATAEILAKRATSDIGTVGMVPASASATGTVGLRTAILGNGEAYPDVLAAGPLGYAR
ncbi:MAG: cell wall-binding repeat-containing protein, partial [Mycobacteriales bacterium]